VLRVVIFGTGGCGESAKRVISEVDEVEVVAFADNNPLKHGTDFLGCRIWSAEELAMAKDWDCVIVASQWWPQITAQLISLGISARKVHSYQIGNGSALFERLLDEFRPDFLVKVGAETVTARDFPRVLIYSHETLNDSHGTGVLLQRYFGDFPRDHLMSVSIRQVGKPWLRNSITMATGSVGAHNELANALRDFSPDLIYSTALSETDFELVKDLLGLIPRQVPVIQHFMDLIPQQNDRFFESFEALVPAIYEIWALTEPIKRLLETKLDREVRLVTGLLLSFSDCFRKTHRRFCPSFRTVMLGNFYNPEVLPFVSKAWERSRAMLPDLRPVEWLVAPNRVQELLDNGVDTGIQFVWKGFLKGRRLHKELASADMALLPLNANRKAKTSYLKYSLPSRIAEYAAVGLPVVVLSSKDTPLARFVNEHGLGIVISSSSVGETSEAIVDYIKNQAARRIAGAAGRNLAENEFRISRFRSWFNQEIVRLAAPQ